MNISDETRLLINKKWEHGTNRVSWLLFNIKGNYDITTRRNLTKKDGCKYQSSVCYASLPKYLQRQFYSHLATTIVLDDYPKEILSQKDMINWINLSKKNKTLPTYLRAKKIVGSGESLKATFKLRTVTSLPHLYVYLATLRYIKEDPGIVKIVLHLVKDLDINYFLAISVATYHAGKAKGHNIMSYSIPYPTPKKIDSVTYDITESLSLKLFINNPKKYYKVPLLKSSCWNMHSLMRKIVKQHVTTRFRHLDSKKVKIFINLEK